jgi:hypothetical protein
VRQLIEGINVYDAQVRAVTAIAHTVLTHKHRVDTVP